MDRVRSLVFYDSNGRPERLVGVNIDITERKRAELALTERNAQLALAGQAALVGSYAYESDLERMTGLRGVRRHARFARGNHRDDAQPVACQGAPR